MKIIYSSIVVDVPQDEISLFDLRKRIPISYGCRIGDCGLCKITILTGLQNVSKKNTAEEASTESEDERLACQCTIFGDIEIKVP